MNNIALHGPLSRFNVLQDAAEFKDLELADRQCGVGTELHSCLLSEPRFGSEFDQP